MLATFLSIIEQCYSRATHNIPADIWSMFAVTDSVYSMDVRRDKDRGLRAITILCLTNDLLV